MAGMIGRIMAEGSTNAPASSCRSVASKYKTSGSSVQTPLGECGRARLKASKEQAKELAYLDKQIAKYGTEDSSTLSPDQLSALFHDLNGGSVLDETTLAVVMQLADVNTDGVIDAEELKLAIAVWNRASTLTFLDAMFDTYDVKSTGKLDKGAMQKLLTDLNDGKKVHAAEVEYLMISADVNHDGLIDRNELKPAIALWYCNVSPAAKKSSVCVIL